MSEITTVKYLFPLRETRKNSLQGNCTDRKCRALNGKLKNFPNFRPQLNLLKPGTRANNARTVTVALRNPSAISQKSRITTHRNNNQARVCTGLMKLLVSRQLEGRVHHTA